MIFRLTIVLLLLSSAGFSQTDSVVLLYERAQLHVQKREYAQALDDLNSIHTAEPGIQLQVSNFRILLLYQLGRLKEAVQACDDYLAMAPEDASMRITLAEILMSMHNTNEALIQCNWIVQNRPDITLGFIMRAMIYLQLEDPNESKKNIAVIEKRDKETFTDVELAQLSTVYNMTGDFAKSRSSAEMAIARNAAPQVYANLGWALWGLKHYRESVEACTKSLNMMPNFVAYLYRGQSYYALNDYARSESDLKASLKIDPNLESAYVSLGNIYKSRNNFKEACDCWQKAYEISGQDDIAVDLRTYCK